VPGPRWWAAIVRGLQAVVLIGLLAASAGAQESAETIFRDARAYTVRIRTRISTPFMEDVRGSFDGAGFLVDAQRRWVLTNAHVVGQSPSTIQAAFADGAFRPARKIYVDSFTDVAVIEVADDGKQHPVAPINCDGSPDIGEGVGVFGHPLGMPFTGTRGIVSGKTDQFIADLIQTDATVDHGNSGGPMIALRDGKVVGIATAGAGGSKADRVNFATPMRDVCRILTLLREGISPEPPRMEFSLLIDEDGRHTLEVGASYDQSRWPFQPGDRILAVGAERQGIATLSNLITALRGRQGMVPIRVTRHGREVEIRTKPGRQPSVLARRGVSIDGALIAEFAFEDSPSPKERIRLVVHSIEPGSGAEARGLEEMDILQSIDDRRFGDLESLLGYLDRRPKGSPIRMVFMRASDSTDRLFEFHVRDLPGEEVRIIGPENQLVSRTR
jgi:serine protease Do